MNTVTPHDSVYHVHHHLFSLMRMKTTHQCSVFSCYNWCLDGCEPEPNRNIRQPTRSLCDDAHHFNMAPVAVAVNTHLKMSCVGLHLQFSLFF